MYTPSQELLSKYAQVMVHFALNGGKGIKKGETVWLFSKESSKELFLAIAKEIWSAGGNVITYFLPDEFTGYGVSRSLLETGTDEQLLFFPRTYWQGIVDSTDHILVIASDPSPELLKGISSEKISKLSGAMSPFMEMRARAIKEGKLGWTLCLYPTESLAYEAGLTLEEYWHEVAQACYLFDKNPVLEWRNMQREIEALKRTLNSLEIQKVHIIGDDVDLQITIGEKRRWLGVSGHNIPSFEVFTSPDWRGTQGWINFNQPLYYLGRKISGIRLVFENGLVVQATADENEDMLTQMIAHENANKIGEFSLTDARHSRITKFMAQVLYDENQGGMYGNTHIALGNAYQEAFTGDTSTLSEEDWAKLGFNKCPKVHTDIVSTSKRTVTAFLKNGSEKVIYKDGYFTL